MNETLRRQLQEQEQVYRESVRVEKSNLQAELYLAKRHRDEALEDRNKLQDEIEKVKKEVKGMSDKCDNCAKLSEQNIVLIKELDSVKEQNMFLKKNEAYIIEE